MWAQAPMTSGFLVGSTLLKMELLPSKSMWHQSSQNPNINLSWQFTSNLEYIYHAYHIFSSKAANKQDITRVETWTWQQGIDIKYSSNKHQTNIFIVLNFQNACSLNAWLTSLILLHHSIYASMHDHINGCA